MPGGYGRKKGARSKIKKYKRKVWLCHRPKDTDQIQDEIKKSIETGIPADKFEFDDELPGGGQFFCVETGKHFADAKSLADHKKSRYYKRRCKDLKEEKYTQDVADAAAGMTKEVLPPAHPVARNPVRTILWYRNTDLQSQVTRESQIKSNPTKSLNLNRRVGSTTTTMRVVVAKVFLSPALLTFAFPKSSSVASFAPSLLSPAATVPHRILPLFPFALFGTNANTDTTMTAAAANADVTNFIDATNAQYERLHRAFELQFWGTKMALSSTEYSTAELTRTKSEMEEFLADASKLAKTREFLTSIPENSVEATTLKMFERTFGCYIMESEAAKQLRSEATNIEGQLESARNKLSLGATINGKFEEMSSVGLRNKVRVDPDENVRKACYQGLTKIGDFVTENGFVELVKIRNKMAKTLGYLDFYDYKVTNAEGFGKIALFEILDTLEKGTRPILEEARKRFAEENGGADALEPWNLSFLMAGDVTRRMDPYFPFEKSVEQWGRSFSAMNISYRGATMDLDLLDRKGKYSNGFCHWPQPAWVKPDGSWQPSTTHFTSLADPSAVGSGYTGLTTLMHEAGHAAHFANIEMPSPLFSQERSPTSVAYAENQSMFLDSLVGDADWMAKYAISREGEAIPWELVADQIKATHPFKVFSLRGMLAVPYFEKALYEMPEDEVTAESIKSLANRVEVDIQGGLSARPLLSVPHILSDEASCYYHGYVLADMSVHQTRDFFLKRDGYLTDNPQIGPTLTEAYWKVGNSKPFLSLVENLTGAPLTGQAWVNDLKKSVHDVLKEEKSKYDSKRAECAEDSHADIDLDMRIRIVDGDDILADISKEGSFLAVCRVFEEYVQNRFSKVQ